MRCSTTSIIVLVELQQAWREDFADQYRLAAEAKLRATRPEHARNLVGMLQRRHGRSEQRMPAIDAVESHRSTAESGVREE